jgi:putative hemolysin
MRATVPRALADYPVHPEALPVEMPGLARYQLEFARDIDLLDAILRLRFDVFNLELGEGLETSHQTGRDLDEFDPFCHHLAVRENASGTVVGTYRMQTNEMAASCHGFYSADEFQLSSLPDEVLGQSVEIGRACVALEHRHHAVLFLLWKGLATYLAHNRKRYLFGCCSLTSQDPDEGLAMYRKLQADGVVHQDLEILPTEAYACQPSGRELDPDSLKVPKLFRTYLRFGALVCGPPAIDRRFKTIDFLVLFDLARLDPKSYNTFFAAR